MFFETIHENYIAPLINSVVGLFIKKYINRRIAKNKSNSSKEVRKRLLSYIKKYKYYIFTVLVVLLLVLFVITFYRIALKTGSELPTGNSTKETIMDTTSINPIPNSVEEQGSEPAPTEGGKDSIQVNREIEQGKTGNKPVLDDPIEREIIIEGIGFDYDKYKAIDNAYNSACQKLSKRGFSSEKVKYREVIERKVDTLPNGIQAIVTVKITAK